jgi:uncharacterized protein YecE (DUF72 family)
MPEYSPEDRKEIAARVQQLLEAGRDVYVFFKHEETPAGALYAEELLRSFPSQTGAVDPIGPTDGASKEDQTGEAGQGRASSR